MSQMAQVLPSLSELGNTSEIGQKNILLPTGGTTGGMMKEGSIISKIPLNKGRYKGEKQKKLEARNIPSLVVMYHWKS